MRGNPCRLGAGRGVSRSIPAHAGQPISPRCERRFAWVYPRACGATIQLRAFPASAMGLSPRMRGNLYRVLPETIAKRSIPAHAGQPGILTGKSRNRSVYPRACGATGRPLIFLSPAIGLSPRMRGNQTNTASSSCIRRSIPAHAGQPALMSETPRQVKVYPRACGATPFAQLVNGFMRGLSPRMRGNHIQYRNIRKRYRSIPAHAGQPQQAIPAPNTARVYPRACGATLSVVVVMMNGGGLSPRMRGNRIGLVDAPTLIRSIPAHAGQP